ncbi:MAG: hypothetical protein ACLRWQ_00995 [Flavonifractor plautii]
MKKFLSLLLVLGLLGSSQAALAAEESPAPLPGWSHSILADGYFPGPVRGRDRRPAQPDCDHGAGGGPGPDGGGQAGPAGPRAPARRRDRPGAGHHPGRRGERPVSGGRRLCLPRRGAGA